MTDPIVEISDGKLMGYQSMTLNNKRYYGFKGIPYAKPPVGQLRFSVPVPPEPWAGVRDAARECNTCIQLDRATQAVVGDEDCLYLNVYTPTLKNQVTSPGHPVMVYVHGGGFMFGSGTDPATHGPDFLVEKDFSEDAAAHPPVYPLVASYDTHGKRGGGAILGRHHTADVILVSFNYRLGILGFLSLDHKDAPGNMGLRDQVQVLKWVQKNISQFGGDPGNITVFGISAGAASVEYLLLSPMARGLFHKALMQSGSSLLHWAFNENMKEIIQKIPQLKDKAKNPNDQLQILKDLPSRELIEASMAALSSDTNWKGGIHYGFVPVVEKPGDWEPFLDKNPYELLSRGEFTRVPIMSGYCSREGLILRAFPTSLDKLKQDKTFLNHLPFEIDDNRKADLETKLKTIYPESETRGGEDDDYAVDFFSDVDFIGGIYVSASLLSKEHHPVYLYEFSYSGGLNCLKVKLGIKSPGACHGDDGGYVMSSAWLPPALASGTDRLVRDRMVTLFTNFAKYGDPTPETDGVISTRWEPLAPGGRCLFVSDRLSMVPFPYAARGQLFQQLFSGQYAAKK